jgi:hypothetical protein
MAPINEDLPGATPSTRARSAGPRGEVPRWLVIGGSTAALTLLVALLRFAIDLLGLVFLLVLVGFSLRALSDWLADGDSVSGWSVTAVVLSVFGTFAIGLWLFDGRDMARSTVIERRLPVVLTRAIDWAESHGWGRRVLLPGGPIDRMARREGAGPSAAQVTAPASPGAPDSRSAATETLAAGKTPQGQGSQAGTTRTAPRRRERIRMRGVEAEASERAEGSGTASPASPENDSGAQAPLVRTAIHLESTQPAARVGTSVRLVATVSADAAARPPTGMVVFRSGDEVLGSARLALQDGAATASLVVLRLQVGSHAVTAEYLGQDGFDGSRSPVLTQLVTRN